MSGWNEAKGWFELTATKEAWWHRHCADKSYGKHIVAVLAEHELKAVYRGNWRAVTYVGDPAKLAELEGLSYLGPVGVLICDALSLSCGAEHAHKPYLPEWRWSADGAR